MQQIIEFILELEKLKGVTRKIAMRIRQSTAGSLHC